MAPRAVLMGPPGAGKTSVGKALARLWGVDLRDTDADVEAMAGMRVSDIFVESGEAHFRELEAAAVLAALADHDGVVALGGGAPMTDAVAQALRHYAGGGGAVVFLDVSLQAVAPRVGLNANRPLLLGNPRQQWKALMDARRPTYEELATITVTTDRGSAAALAEQIDREVS